MQKVQGGFSTLADALRFLRNLCIRGRTPPVNYFSFINQKQEGDRSLGAAHSPHHRERRLRRERRVHNLARLQERREEGLLHM